MSQHRGRRIAAPARPRYGRLVAFVLAVLVTGFALATGLGVTPSEHPLAYAATPRAVLAGEKSDPRASAAQKDDAAVMAKLASRAATRLAEAAAAAAARVIPALPPDSGTGRRVVFDQSDQRVWLVSASGRVKRSYLGSGSVEDNLHPGTYAVYSRSRHAWGIQDSGTMEFMVRFTTGDHSPIGFHDIPVKDGQPVQTQGQLGTPQSHGCIRQARPDAIALWRFAGIGTVVVVTA